MKKNILVVDDDTTIRLAIKSYFEFKGFEVSVAGSLADGQIAFRSRRPDAAIIDYMLPDGDALQLLERFRAIDPNCPVIVLTGHASVDLAVRAIQEGASQFLTKPVKLDALEAVVERALADDALRRQDAARRSASGARAIDPFAGESRAMGALAARAKKVAASELPVLILGETGTGKGVLSRWIHENGPRRRGPFVDLNCAGLSREFLDTELFGHEKGAFTGAIAAKQGLFEVSHGGSLFLDEIGDVDQQLQPKLLKVVEEKRFRRLGEVSDRMVDVRLIGATHHDLEAMARDGRFRSDLYFRIATIALVIPPLRERNEDIPALASQMLSDISRSVGRPGMTLSDAASRKLQSYAWPGNVREMRNALERAVLLADHDVLDVNDFALTFHGSNAPASNDELRLTLEQMERLHIERVLADEEGRVDRAAERLAVPRSSLYQKIKRFGIQVAPSRSRP
ncbi:MAG TPA: sigma-54 dependent transcriptional regulator [Thermoanaerobaculia bacterium]|nr:sigma-54 dependent transcriptional regulator [Thermoanaerobaculia bacterium]